MQYNQLVYIQKLPTWDEKKTRSPRVYLPIPPPSPITSLSLDDTLFYLLVLVGHRPRRRPLFVRSNLSFEIMQHTKKAKIVYMGPGGKIHREEGKHPDQLENTIAQALVDLSSASSSEPEYKDLVFVDAKEFQATGENKVVVVHIPLRWNHQYRKVQGKLVRELEKKLAGRTVVLVARRKILPKAKKGARGASGLRKRPISKTLTAVHDKILEDIVYPVEIVGKRIRFRQDGSRVIIVLLDPKEQHNVEHKLDAFRTAYKKLTGKDAVFQFPVHA